MMELINAVMVKLLEGDSENLAVLRRQFEASVMGDVELTGVGFFAHFDVPETAEKLEKKEKSFAFCDVAAEMKGLKHGAGFVLFVEDGVIDFLEGYSYDEPWPEKVTTFELKYLNNKRNI